MGQRGFGMSRRGGKSTDFRLDLPSTRLPSLATTGSWRWAARAIGSKSGTCGRTGEWPPSTATPARSPAYNSRRTAGPCPRTDPPSRYAVSALLREPDGRVVEGPPIPAVPIAMPAGWTGTSMNERRHTGSVWSASGEITLRGSGDEFANLADGGYFL